MDQLCVLAGFECIDIDSNDIIFTVKDKSIVTVVTLSAKDNQKLSKLLRKEFERQVSWNGGKTKSENKNMTNSV